MAEHRHSLRQKRSMRWNKVERWSSRGYLPHYDVSGQVQHVIFRLADSLPLQVLQTTAQTTPDERLPAIDRALDQGLGSRALAEPRVADLVCDALRHFDGERYRLRTWCVMPNHVLVLVEMGNASSLAQVIHSWKSFTAVKANQLLGCNGAFWAREYFDRAIRGDEDFTRTWAYIDRNPLAAGLIGADEIWRWSSVSIGPRPSGPAGSRRS
jgi:REP element-mobilizing transposase RayT